MRELVVLNTIGDPVNNFYKTPRYESLLDTGIFEKFGIHFFQPIYSY